MAVRPLAFRLKYSPEKVSERWFLGIALGGLLFMIGVIVLLVAFKPWPVAKPEQTPAVHHPSQR